MLLKKSQEGGGRGKGNQRELRACSVQVTLKPPQAHHVTAVLDDHAACSGLLVRLTMSRMFVCVNTTCSIPALCGEGHPNHISPLLGPLVSCSDHQPVWPGSPPTQNLSPSYCPPSPAWVTLSRCCGPGPANHTAQVTIAWNPGPLYHLHQAKVTPSRDLQGLCSPYHPARPGHAHCRTEVPTSSDTQPSKGQPHSGFGSFLSLPSPA